MDIPFGTKLSPGAFSGDLICPFCNAEGMKKTRWSYVEHITPVRIRYRCKDCTRTVQYDFGMRDDHPFEPFKRNIFRDMVERWKQKKKKLKVA